MFRDVVTRSDRPEDWPRIRAEIEGRVRATLGDPPVLEDSPFEVGAEERRDGLGHRPVRFCAVPGHVTHGTLVLPAEPGARPAVLCIHGTDPDLAHRNVLSPELKPHRQYAIELARRGFVTLAVDQFAFGEGNAGRPQAAVVEDFARLHPGWSLDGARLRVHQRALDLLAAQAEVDPGHLGCIGHSLGGRAAIYLAALDPRIRAAVPSAGISPNLTNVFRNQPGPGSLSPLLERGIRVGGVPPFEYQELIALAAPRALLLLEAWNDGWNPFIVPVLRCVEKARFVYALCQAETGLEILCHGHGHDTPPGIRGYAYAWLEQLLKQ